MNVALRQDWTIERFLDWVERQEGFYEFDGVRPVPMFGDEMNGGTANHSCIIGNLLRILGNALLESAVFQVFSPGYAVQCGRSVRYPDALVTTSRQPGTGRIAIDPRVVFEVISPSSERLDLSMKVQEYGTLPSVTHYVVLRSDAISALVHTRAGASWSATVIAGNGAIALPELGLALSMADIYARTELGSGPAGN